MGFSNHENIEVSLQLGGGRVFTETSKAHLDNRKKLIPVKTTARI